MASELVGTREDQGRWPRGVLLSKWSQVKLSKGTLKGGPEKDKILVLPNPACSITLKYRSLSGPLHISSIQGRTTWASLQPVQLFKAPLRELGFIYYLVNSDHNFLSGVLTFGPDTGLALLMIPELKALEKCTVCVLEESSSLTQCLSPAPDLSLCPQQASTCYQI